MTPRSTWQIRARSRPGAIVVVWVMRALAAWLIATPIVVAIAGSGVGSLPGGDAGLFEPGGLMLLEAVRNDVGALGIAIRQATGTLAVVGALGVVPLALLYVALAYDGPLRLGAWTGRALDHVPSFVFVGGAALLVQALLAVTFGALAWGVRALATARFDDRATDLATLGVVAVGLAAVLAVGIVADVARASVVRHAQRGAAGIHTALRVVRRRPWSTFAGWLVAALWGAAVIVSAAALTGSLAVERPGAWRVACVASAHQLVVIVLIALRAMWLAQSMRLADAFPPPTDD